MALRDGVAARLLERRRAKRLSQEELARRCGLSTSYVSMLERGLRVPTLETLDALSDGLGVPPLALLGGGGAGVVSLLSPPASRAPRTRRRGAR